MHQNIAIISFFSGFFVCGVICFFFRCLSSKFFCKKTVEGSAEKLFKKMTQESHEELLVLSFLALMKKKFPILILANQGRESYMERSLEFLQGYASGHPDDEIVRDIFSICKIIIHKIKSTEEISDLESLVRYVDEISRLRKTCSVMIDRIRATKKEA